MPNLGRNVISSIHSKYLVAAFCILSLFLLRNACRKNFKSCHRSLNHPTLNLMELVLWLLLMHDSISVFACTPQFTQWNVCCKQKRSLHCPTRSWNIISLELKFVDWSVHWTNLSLINERSEALGGDDNINDYTSKLFCRECMANMNNCSDNQKKFSNNFGENLPFPWADPQFCKAETEGLWEEDHHTPCIKCKTQILQWISCKKWDRQNMVDVEHTGSSRRTVFRAN